ncbi:hypothetical protein EDC01DRAFT_790068 [Geopyxis carbonaria]|nr:hypothetical protein EDC01DRAFT_790068 [Geopyxis carbonaria]
MDTTRPPPRGHLPPSQLPPVPWLLWLLIALGILTISAVSLFFCCCTEEGRAPSCTCDTRALLEEEIEARERGGWRQRQQPGRRRECRVHRDLELDGEDKEEEGGGEQRGDGYGSFA